MEIESPARALLVVSGHWEEPALTVGSSPAPRLIFDYSGFPESTYLLTWPAPGDPALAARVEQMLLEASLPAAADANRGFDHGVFVPLKVAFPHAQSRWLLSRLHLLFTAEPMGAAISAYRFDG